MTYPAEVNTPNGVGVIVARFENGNLFVAHNVRNLSEEVRQGLRPGHGKVIHRAYAAEKVSVK